MLKSCLSLFAYEGKEVGLKHKCLYDTLNQNTTIRNNLFYLLLVYLHSKSLDVLYYIKYLVNFVIYNLQRIFLLVTDFMISNTTKNFYLNLPAK